MSRVRETNQQTKGSQLPGDTNQKEYFGNMKLKPKSGKKKKGAKRSNPY